MQLTVGDQSFDLTTRALVMGTVDAGRDRSPALVGHDAERLVAEGADIVEVSAPDGEEAGEAAEAVAAVVAAVHAPVAVASKRWEVVAAAYTAGAVLGTPATGRTDRDFLRATAGAGASVILRGAAPPDEGADRRAALLELARDAEAAGIPRERIVLKPAVDASVLAHAQRLAELGYPLLLSLSAITIAALGGHPALGPDDQRALGLVATALAVTGGWRLVRTSDVKGARRVCDVLAAVLEASHR